MYLCNTVAFGQKYREEFELYNMQLIKLVNIESFSTCNKIRLMQINHDGTRKSIRSSRAFLQVEINPILKNNKSN